MSDLLSNSENQPDIPINQIISRVKHLEIRAKKLVQDTLQSDYHSVFKGRGIEFNEVRNYFPGDDIRDIDWNVTARMGEPYIKTYIEERQLTVLFAVDVSGSMLFGSQKSKRQMMAEIVALLGFASFFNNDRAGLVLFSNDVEKVVPPGKDHSHLLRIIRDSWYYVPQEKGTDLNASFRSLANVMKKRVIIFVLSDFLSAGYDKALISLSKKHEVIPIVVNDVMEENFDLTVKTRFPVLVDVEDLELGLTRTIDISRQRQSDIARFREKYRNLFKKLGLDYTEVNSGEDYFKKIEMLLRNRSRRTTGHSSFSKSGGGSPSESKERSVKGVNPDIKTSLAPDNSRSYNQRAATHDIPIARWDQKDENLERELERKYAKPEIPNVQPIEKPVTLEVQPIEEPLIPEAQPIESKPLTGMIEMKHVRQIVGEGFRRWFSGDYFDLFVWYDSDYPTDQSDTNHIAGFQLSYDKENKERALTWKEKSGFTHDLVDDGEIRPTEDRTPILMKDGTVEIDSVIRRFKSESSKIDQAVTKFVLNKLRQLK